MTKKVTIIAEAGVNHNGSMEMAKQLIDAAANAGADIVKFQTFQANKLVTRQALKADYQVDPQNKQESQFEMLKKLELTQRDHEELMAYCRKKNIEFLSTPFDRESLKLIYDLGLRTIKIPSGELTNFPLLREIAQLKNITVILSSGMSTLEEIKKSIEVLERFGLSKNFITVLHCHTDYPTAMNDIHLKAMDSIKNELGVKIGYSDHSLGIEVPIAAVALGAEIIEKHFTLDKNMEGPDHKASLDPLELKNMVSAIRNIELALGGAVKEPTEKEIKMMAIARKSIVASKKIKKGEVFTEDNLTTKRPGNGLSPMAWEKVLGTISPSDYEEDDII